MKAIEIAKGIKALFQNEHAWMQGDYASNYTENDTLGLIDPFDERANCFCLQGAVDKVSGFAFFSGDHTREVFEKQPEIAKIAVTMLLTLEERGEAVDRVEYDLLDRFLPIARWNDKPARTIDEVRGFVDEVVSRLEKETA